MTTLDQILNVITELKQVSDLLGAITWLLG